MSRSPGLSPIATPARKGDSPWSSQTVFLLHSIPTQGVVIKAGVFEEADPFLPAWRHVGAIVFIKVLPEES